MEDYRIKKTYDRVIVAQRKDGKWGVTSLSGEEIVPFGKYGWIEGFDKGLSRVRTSGRKIYTGNTVAVINDDRILTSPSEILEDMIKNFEESPESFEKWGIINESGEEVLPCQCDEVWKFIGKYRSTTCYTIGGKKYYFDLRGYDPEDQIDSSEEPYYSGRYDEYDDYGTHYGEYAGTYAQDIAGYSDDVINDAFDGEPDAYWNID